MRSCNGAQMWVFGVFVFVAGRPCATVSAQGHGVLSGHLANLNVRQFV